MNEGITPTLVFEQHGNKRVIAHPSYYQHLQIEARS